MFEQVKEILEHEYNEKINTYEVLKQKSNDYEKKFESDKTEEQYKELVKNLNKEYPIFKRKKEYKDKLKDIQKEYYEKLKVFKEEYNQYLDIRKEMVSINIVYIKKELDKLATAKTLSDLKMSEKEAEKLIAKNNQ